MHGCNLREREYGKEPERLSWIKNGNRSESAVSSRVVFVHRSKLPWA